MLHGVYQRGDFDNPSIKCKYFALFAIAQVFSNPHDLSDTSNVPGLAYFAKAWSLIQIVPERPSMIHIESLLLIVSPLVGSHLGSCLLSVGLLLPIFEPLSHRLPFDRKCITTRPQHGPKL